MTVDSAILTVARDEALGRATPHLRAYCRFPANVEQWHAALIVLEAEAACEEATLHAAVAAARQTHAAVCRDTGWARVRDVTLDQIDDLYQQQKKALRVRRNRLRTLRDEAEGAVRKRERIRRCQEQMAADAARKAAQAPGAPAQNVVKYHS